MRIVNIIHHVHGTTIQVEDHRPWHRPIGWTWERTRYHYLPTNTSYYRLIRLIDHWPHRAAYTLTYQEVT